MPAVHLYEDGYNRGDATDEELIALADRVKEDGWKDCYYKSLMMRVFSKVLKKNLSLFLKIML